jgi:outer membrane protein OmpA-like peptidoglycan-associated protein
MLWSDDPMKKALITIALLGGGLVLAGCAREAGGGDRQDEIGQAVALNNARQVAYKTAADRLTDLGRVFAAETEETVTFAFNSARLDATARRALDGQAAWLKAHPEVRMTIEGHTDAVGAEAYNDRLGLRRAQAVVDYLVRRGVSRSRLDAVESFGESRLVVETEARERRNRRAVTEVAGFVRNFVGFGMDGVLAARLFDIYQGTGGGTVAEAEASDTGE